MKKLLLGLALALAGVQAVSASDDALYHEANRLYFLINDNVAKLDEEGRRGLAAFKKAYVDKKSGQVSKARFLKLDSESVEEIIEALRDMIREYGISYVEGRMAGAGSGSVTSESASVDASPISRRDVAEKDNSWVIGPDTTWADVRARAAAINREAAVEEVP